MFTHRLRFLTESRIKVELCFLAGKYFSHEGDKCCCCFTASNGVTVTVVRSGGKACDRSVALTCLLTSQDERLIVIEFSWMLNQTQGSTKVLCGINEKVDGIGCEYKNNSLVLTIEEVQQSNNGVYICKALTSAGHDSEEYILNITGDSGSSEAFPSFGFISFVLEPAW